MSNQAGTGDGDRRTIALAYCGIVVGNLTAEVADPSIAVAAQHWAGCQGPRRARLSTWRWRREGDGTATSCRYPFTHLARRACRILRLGACDRRRLVSLPAKNERIQCTAPDVIRAEACTSVPGRSLRRTGYARPVTSRTRSVLGGAERYFLPLYFVPTYLIY